MVGAAARVGSPVECAIICDPGHRYHLVRHEPGVEILRELLDSLQSQPATSTAQLLERWRDHPAGERLARLAVSESIIPDEHAAGNELLTAVQKLAQAPAGAELDALLAKEQESGLDGPERERLLQLLREARPAAR